MDVDGPQLIAEVQQTRQQLQEEAARVEEEKAAGEQRLDEAIVRRGETFVELARHYLPAVSKEAVDRSFAGLRDELSNVLARRERESRRLREAIAELETRRRRLEAGLETLTGQLNEKVQQRDALESQLAHRLAADPEFERLAEETLIAKKRLAQNEQRVQEIQREAEEKLPAYRQSDLFGYLYRRRFGTSEYRGRGPTRRLDAWVASLIDYGRARRSYEFLLVMPRLMAEEVQRRRQECEELVTRLETLREAVAESIGWNAVVRDGERLGQQRQRAATDLDRLAEELDPLQEELAKIEQSQDRFYDEALGRFTAFLESTSTVVLQQQASRTPEPQDDEIVAEIQWLNEQAETFRSRIGELNEQGRQLDRRIRGLDYLLRRCRQSDIDSQRCYFDDGLALQDHIDQYLRDDIDQHELLKRIRRHQHFRPTWAEKAADRTIQTLEKPGVQMVLHLAAAAAGHALRWFLLEGGAGRRGRPGSSSPPARNRFTGGPGF
jgi:chromosome segregation ATPase